MTQTLATTPREIALNDVFTTALEGGIGYWSYCTLYKWSDGNSNAINEFVAEIEDVEDEDEKWTIDAKVIRRGIKKAFKYFSTTDNVNQYHWRALSCLQFGKYNDLDMDADTADIIVQFGLFGKLVYG